MPRKKWKSVSLRQNFIDIIDEHIKSDTEHTWRSRAAFIGHAVKELLTNYEPDSMGVKMA